MTRAQAWIDRLGMVRHPEGGWYVETYRAEALTANDRNLSTAIYYLLETGDLSRFHRLASDEIWHVYDGSGLVLYLLGPDGHGERVALGADLERSERPQFLVPADTWIAAQVEPPGEYTLCGCTVAPGFAFADFEMARREQLLESHPGHATWISQFSA